MATWILTPKNPDPLTGFTNPVLGWQFTVASIADVYTGCNLVFEGGWSPQMGPLGSALTNTSKPPLWQLVLSKGVDQVVINDTDYFVFDGVNVWDIPQATVEADYTVTQQGGS
jgi:hypothetical protein